jgi:rod shape-determining protein MreD
MSRVEDSGWFVPMLTLIAALALAVVAVRPDWVAMAFLYWTLIAPGRIGLFTAFFAGLALDALSGSLLGQHGLALLLIVYLAQRLYLRIRAFPISQLGLTILVLLSLYEFMLFWIDGVAGRTVPLIERWGAVVGSAVFWVVILVGADRRRQHADARF